MGSIDHGNGANAVPLHPEDALHDLVDGALSPESTEAVLQYMADHPEAAELVEAATRINRLLQESAAADLEDPIPAPLRAQMQALAAALRQAEESESMTSPKLG